MIGTQIRKFRRKQRFGLSEYAHRAWMCKIRMSPVARGIKYPSVEKNHSITAALQSPLLTLFLNGIDASFIGLCSSPILGHCLLS